MKRPATFTLLLLSVASSCFADPLPSSWYTERFGSYARPDDAENFNDQHSPIIGGVSDGLPAYSAYAYSDPLDPDSAVRPCFPATSCAPTSPPTALPVIAGGLGKPRVWRRGPQLRSQS